MSENRTSKAVERLVNARVFATPSAAKAFLAISEKYKRMEEALRYAEQYGGLDNSEAAYQIKQSLAFDPLSQDHE